MSTVEFIKSKLSDAEKTLRSREEMEHVWRNGTDEEWRSVGCKLTKSERVRDADMHRRIAEKNRFEVEMFKMVLKSLDDEAVS